MYAASPGPKDNTFPSHLSRDIVKLTGRFYIPTASEAQGLAGPTPDYARG